jgi:hypothetical protein
MKEKKMIAQTFILFFVVFKIVLKFLFFWVFTDIKNLPLKVEK